MFYKAPIQELLYLVNLHWMIYVDSLLTLRGNNIPFFQYRKLLIMYVSLQRLV